MVPSDGDAGAAAARPDLERLGDRQAGRLAAAILSHVGAFQRAIPSCRLDCESLGGAGLMNNARLHCAGLLPGVQITVGSAVASSGSARISAAIHPGPVQVELRPHSAASART